jgi:GTPase SAR1 family protein
MNEDEYYLHQHKDNKTYTNINTNTNTNTQASYLRRDIINININKQPKKKITGLEMRIAIIGERKCGKTAFINCYLKKEFSLDKQDTILNMHAKKITISNHAVTLIIYEISEDPSDRTIFTKAIKDVHAVLICYSLEDSSKYFNSTMLNESLDALNNEIDKRVPLFMVGCKYDLVHEKVVNELNIYDDLHQQTFTDIGKQIKEYIETKRNELQLNISGYYVTSALFNINIDKVFNDTIKTIAMPYILMNVDHNMKKGQQRMYHNNDINDSNYRNNMLRGGGGGGVNVSIADEKGCVLF